MIPSACNLYVHPLIVILCKGTCIICFTGANTGTYNLMKENAFSSDFLQNVHLLLTTILLVIIQLQPQSFTKTSVSSCRTICPGLNILLGPTIYLVLFAVLLVEVIIQTSKNPLIRSQLTYCSQVWRPHLLKHIMSLERVQCRATKFILNDFSSDYKSRLVAR